MVSWREPHGPVELMVPECCPIPATHDHLKEAHYFLHDLVEHVHHPDPFRWSLNAYLQASRSVLLLATKELKAAEGFDGWKKSILETLEADDPLFRRVVASRNFIVHEKMLNDHSRTQAGIFRGRRFKLGFGEDAPNTWYSESLLGFLAHVWTGVFINPDHGSVGEQFGVKRTWVVTELGDEDVALLCDRAYAKLVEFVRSAHELAGGEPAECTESSHRHDADAWSVLLESDLDPDLPRRWGWTDEHDSAAPDEAPAPTKPVGSAAV
jgi:hypothetical protein